VKVMVFKEVPTLHIGVLMLDFSGTDGDNPPNFVPFATIGPYLMGANGLIIAGINLIGNIVFLMPVGLLAPFRWRQGWKPVLGLAIATALAIETLQTVLRVGIFDVDDVILNALGVMIGYWTLLILTRWATLLVVGAASGALYAIYPKGDHPSVATDRRPGAGGRGLEGETPAQGDLCNGTGGTGQIVTTGGGALTIKRKDGLVQSFRVTEATTIRNSNGAASEADLSPGDRVTLVVLDDSTASAVLVCDPTSGRS
jgi:hypothetical protein